MIVLCFSNVVIAGDGTGADICLRTNFGITDIGQ